MTSTSNQSEFDPRVRIFELGADRHLHPITTEEPSPSWLRDETVRWIAVQDFSPVDVAQLCQSCGIELPPQILLVLENPAQRPQAVGLEKLLLISFTTGFDENTRHVQALCAPSTILTFHQTCDLADELERDFLHECHFRGLAPATILLELIDRVLAQLVSRAFDLRHELVTLNDELEANTRKLDGEEHLSLKQKSTELEIQFEDQLYCLTQLAKFESESVDTKSVRPLILELMDGIDRGLQAVTRLKDRISALHELQVRQADETTNRRLKILTVLSAIYMPATLVAGIYGMNFSDIPISDISHGYAYVMLLMVVIVVGQLIYFYRRGWFK